MNKINVSIPQAFANVIKKATHRNPEYRHKSMYHLFNDLNTCQSKERRNEPKINFDGKQPVTFMSIINSKFFLVGIIIFTIIILMIVVVTITLVISA